MNTFTHGHGVRTVSNFDPDSTLPRLRRAIVIEGLIPIDSEFVDSWMGDEGHFTRIQYFWYW